MMLSLLVVTAMLCAQLTCAVQVETKYGIVQGQVETLTDDYYSGTQLNTFYSIPFATPPVGDLRFTAPDEPEPYDDVFIADEIRSACEQGMPEGPLWSDYSEDCLYLNIYAPTDDSSGPYPVMLYIYGGAYQWGNGVTYQGHFLAAQGVVVVVPNYRLGIFGFAYSGDDVIPGNMGLMDQALGMQYVQENIAAFGGDPQRVTIFGQSAGACAVGLQMMSPKTEGLFHQAILQSGNEYLQWAVNGPQHEPENYLKDVAEQLDCPTEDSIEMADCLRSKTVDELLQTSFTCAEGRRCVGFAPVVDGEEGFLPDVPWNLRMREEFHQVPEIIGLNRHDSGFGSGNMTYEEFEARIRLEVRSRVAAFPDPEREEDAVQAMLFYYSPWPHLDDGELLTHQYGEFTTDTSYGAPADEQAKQHRGYAPTYFYIFDYRRDGVNEAEHTTHGFELPYVFGYPFISQNPHIQNMTGLPELIDFVDLDFEYSHFMMTLWTDFAKYGNPTPVPLETPGEHDPVTWETYTEENLNYINIGRDVLENAEDFRQHEYAFWQQYMVWLTLGDDGVNP